MLLLKTKSKTIEQKLSSLRRAMIVLVLRKFENKGSRGAFAPKKKIGVNPGKIQAKNNIKFH